MSLFWYVMRYNPTNMERDVPTRMIRALLALPLLGIASQAMAQADDTKDSMVCLAIIKASLADTASADAAKGPELAAALMGPAMINTLNGLHMFYMGRLSGQYSGLDAGMLSTFSISYQSEIETAVAAFAKYRADKGAVEVEPGLSKCLAVFGQAADKLGGNK
jgi:hypothetical protein